MSGLFLNDPASCGPINPLLSLSKHTDLQSTNNSSSLNNLSQSKNLNNSNRFLKFDNNLNNEFNQFNSQQPVYSQQFSQIPIQHLQQQQQQPIHTPLQNLQPILNSSLQPNISQQRIQHNTQQSNTWANDFAKLSLNQQVNNQQISQPSSFQQRQFYPTNLISTQNLLTEHQELHRSNNDIDQSFKFDQMFNEIETEILQTTEPTISSTDLDRENFAKTAKLVANAMSSNKLTNSTLIQQKFKNSNFLKLMNKVSEKTVIINDKGDGFISNE